ncbi:ABC transporter permease [Tropicibacter oceani]|uniref:Transport permease protein n=1 Tax=Tropicibacter oceani TaxID=3058420 RepID=A0ABY8QN46_9RHOB|nr:ABC transporter permease [Tropicibacter oceani]WGW06044.1 ABC transporter permease [Tropicibacter oceani]
MSLPPPLTAPQAPRILQERPNRKFASFRAVSALMLREMATRYGNSPGGYIWAILEPLGAILVMALAFSLIVRSPPLGNNFILFYATGFMPFQLYQQISSTVSSSINFSRPLLQYPAVTWADAVMARLFLNALTGVLVTIIVMSSLLIVTDTKVLLDLSPALAAMSLAILLGLGIGSVNCVLFGLFPVWSQIWGILNRPLVLASGVIFLFDDLPPAIQDILWYNPLIHVTGEMRTGFYPTYRPDYISLLLPALIGVITLFFGVLLMGRYHRDLLNNR